MKPVRIRQPSFHSCVPSSFNAKQNFSFERHRDGRMRCWFTRAARFATFIVVTQGTRLPSLHAAPAAAADTRDAAAGEVMFREGRRLLKAGDLQGACAKLEESQRLDPAPGTLANLADCEEQLGRTASAWEHWRRTAELLPANDARRATAQARSTELEKKLPRLTITLAPELHPTPIAGLRIERDGVALGAVSLGVALPLDPGAHVVLVSAPDHQPRRFDLVIGAGEQRQLSVSVGPRALATSAARIAADTAGSSPLDLHASAPPPSTGRARHITGYVLLGAGVAAIGTGIFFGTRALQARSDAKSDCAAPDGSGHAPVCWARARDALMRDTTYSRLADAGIAGGAIAALVGGYLAFTGRARPGDSQRVAWSAAPTVDGAEVSLAARF
jgi:hypothetical protein